MVAATAGCSKTDDIADRNGRIGDDFGVPPELALPDAPMDDEFALVDKDNDLSGNCWLGQRLHQHLIPRQQRGGHAVADDAEPIVSPGDQFAPEDGIDRGWFVGAGVGVSHLRNSLSESNQ